MKPETRLDSAVFQLTPTRTRYDLFIVANGKKEKIASGLLNPFLAHLKCAQDQIEKGGYSITLEPSLGGNQTTEWFTKGTMERFVRFVSTPEVLERVNTIDSEIIQIEEALAIQGNENIGLSAAEDHQTRSSESNEGRRCVFDADAEKAIVPYKPGAYSPESNGHEENSKAQLLRVLETRKSMLQKEQGMAFARAIAADFGMDNIAHLVLFSQCFGALRLREACSRFMDLWKRKHETDQWLEGTEIEAAEATSSRSDFSSMNASGIMLSGETRKLKEFREVLPDFHVERGAKSNGKTNSEVNADANSDHLTSECSRSPQVPLGPHEYYQGQFQHPMFPQWPHYSPQGAPVFPAYPMQGMPYYQSYPGSGTFFQPPYPPMEDPRLNATQRMGRRHSMDSKDSNLDPVAYEMDASVTRSQDSGDQDMQLESDREALAGRESCRKSCKTQSGMVVIRNINYITSKRQNTTGSKSESDSNYETEEGEDLRREERKQMNSVRSSRKKESNINSTDTQDFYDRGNVVSEGEADSGSWQAFQNCLLRDDEESTSGVDRGFFSPDKEAYVKRQQVTNGGDSTLIPERDLGGNTDRRKSEFYIADGKTSRIYKHKVSNDELVVSHGEFLSSDVRELRDGQRNVQFNATEGGWGGYRRMANDDFMIYAQQNELGISASMSDPLAINEMELSYSEDRSLANNLTDESFIVPFRSRSHDRVGRDNRSAICMDSELPSTPQRRVDSSGRIKILESYEPADLNIMPERGAERVYTGYDLAIDNEMLVCAEMPASALDVGLVGNGNREGIGMVDKEGLKKSDKEKKLTSTRVSLEKRKMDLTKKGKPLKLSPLAEAQVRAERLRAFKADMQKVKKEKEEEDIKRLEALKRERQKRIAARGSQGPIQSQLPSQQNRSRLPTKFSPTSQRGSKFSDTETGSSSPIMKLAIKTARGSQSPIQSPLPSQQTKSRLPTKFSPSSQRGLKFSDTETGSSSPITNLAIKTARGSQSPIQSPLPSQQPRSRLPTKFSPSSQKDSKFSDTETGSSSPITKLAKKTARGSQSPIQSPLPSQQTRSQPPTKCSPRSQRGSKFSDDETGSPSPITKLANKTARGSQSPIQSPLPSQHTRSRLPTKFSPSPQRGSKLSDTEAGSSSPITKLAIKTAPVGPSDSQKTSKSSSLNVARLSGNGLRKSVSSLPKIKKENNSLLSESKPASIQTRRLSDAKSRTSLRVSPLKSGAILKSRASSEPEIKKISTITNLNRSKSPADHELRVRTTKSSSDAVQNKLAVKETVLRGKRRKSVTSETIKTRNSISKFSSHNNPSENVVIEKSIVTVENEMPTAVIPRFSKENMDFRKEPNDDELGKREKAKLVSEYVVVQAPASPVTKVEVEQCNSNGVTLDYGRVELPLKEPSINTDEKSYHAPYARNSSSEDPCTRNSEYTRALPPSSESVETVRAHVPDLMKLSLSEQIPDALETLPSKESSKGFRRLLKFGRKNHRSGAGESNAEPEPPRVDGLATDGHIASSNSATGGHTLKNLISRGDSHSGASSQKVSRPLSLLAPFRSKASETLTR